MKLRGWEAMVRRWLCRASLWAPSERQEDGSQRAVSIHRPSPRPTPPPLNGICRKTDTSFAKRPFGTLHSLRAAVFLRMQMAFGAIACEAHAGKESGNTTGNASKLSLKPLRVLS